MVQFFEQLPYRHTKGKRDKFDHVILIYGFDTTAQDPSEHCVCVKNTYGKGWGADGVSRIVVDDLEELVVPRYNHEEPIKLRSEEEEEKQKHDIEVKAVAKSKDLKVAYGMDDQTKICLEILEKGLDWEKVDLEIEAKKVSSRPTSSHSNSRSGSAQSGRSGEGFGAELQRVEKPKSKVNPFGDAKPREVLLQEKGVDYRKIDLELERRRLGRYETEAEKNFKEEIEYLKRECEKESASNVEKGYNENQTSLHNKILQLEGELEQLSRDLDDKLRLTQKPIERSGSGAGRVGHGFQERPGSGAGRMGSGFHERPGSGAGRVGMGFPERPGSRAGRESCGFQDRPLSQSGSFDESRSVDFSERPPSGGDPWMRPGPPGDDRRGFGGGRDRGLLGNRELGRQVKLKGEMVRVNDK